MSNIEHPFDYAQDKLPSNEEVDRRQTLLRSSSYEGQGCEDCEHSVPAGGSIVATLICRHKADADLPWQVVEPNGACINFERSCELVPVDIESALAEGAKLIPLTQDKFAIVDAEDYGRLSQHKWHVLKRARTEYAGGYRNGKYNKMHRVLLNAPAGLVVDHRDGNGLNNRKSNLRLCTHQENIYNQRPRLGAKSRFRGVCWHKAKNKYIALIQKEGKRYSLGLFHDEIEAAVVYDIKAMELFGEFAYYNFPELMERYKMVNPGAPGLRYTQ